jgi:hypothetical protein
VNEELVSGLSGMKQEAEYRDIEFQAKFENQITASAEDY